LALAFLPLAIALGRPSETLKERIQRVISDEPLEVRVKVDRALNSDDATIEDVLWLLPDHRLPQSFLTRDSQRHLLYALLAAAAYAGLIAICFAAGSANLVHLLLVGLFTGTVGIGLLLTAHSFPPIALFIDICMFAAEDRDSNFFAVLAGFTLGVGLFEELFKMAPLLWYWRRFGQLSWRKACLWGLASGAGFGVAEGIVYSQEYYNGIEDGWAYLVRFASCVALHAIWTATVGITLASNQDLLKAFQKEAGGALATRQKLPGDPEETTGEKVAEWMMLWGLAILRVLVVAMFLHGLYDAALTRDMPLLALLAAVASFGWMTWQIESCRRLEGPAEAPAPA
jgi:RsiW-degrading membrane proteinase PrsW (M82 family)